MSDQIFDIALLINAHEAAAICHVSRSNWWSLVARGLTPKPVKLGGATRWQRYEINKWVMMGCPSRQRFETLKGSVKS